ncbi:hypothetical protein B398_02030 [Xylella fastidiosa 32]|nr:hypothetical protein B398_02030 [Xylella fastidiosa 32]
MNTTKAFPQEEDDATPNPIDQDNFSSKRHRITVRTSIAL